MYMYMWEARWLFRLPMRAQLDVTARSSPGHASMDAGYHVHHAWMFSRLVRLLTGSTEPGRWCISPDWWKPSTTRFSRKTTWPSGSAKPSMVVSPARWRLHIKTRRSFVIAGARWTRRRPGPRLTDRSALSKRGDRVRDLHTTSRL